MKSTNHARDGRAAAECPGVVNALPGLVWIARNDGDPVLLNDAWRAYTGLDTADGVDDGLQYVIHPDDWPRWLDEWRRASTDSRPWEMTLRLRRRDAVYRWFQCRAAPLADASGLTDRWCGINTDIDDQRRLEAQLHAIEANAAEFVGSFPGLLVTMDLAGEVQLFSRETLFYFGKSVDELRGWKMTDAVHPDDLPRVLEAFTESVTTGKPYSIEHRCRRADGVYRWFHVRAHAVRDSGDAITGWYIVLADIDDLKRAEQGIRANESHLQLIINTIPAFAWSAGTDGAAEFFNKHYLDYIGLTADEAKGAGWTSAVHPDDLAGLAAVWQRVLATDTPGEAEARLRRFDGEYRWFLFRTNQLRDESGRTIRWYGINTDIDDRKRAEETLDKARAELAQMTRAASFGVLTASIAHEVNQPLAGIIMNANTCVRMLTATPPNVDGAIETARRSIRDGNRATEVITRLRALFGRKSAPTDLIDLNDATREVMALSLSELQRNRIVVRLDLADDVPPIVGDRVPLQQVILNLSLNAAESMSNVDDRPRLLTVRTRVEGHCVRLSVEDAGVGFRGDTRNKLFQPFYTTKEYGMGIGLSVSRSIIESHRGEIAGTANDGDGATFSFTVPIAPAPP